MTKYYVYKNDGENEEYIPFDNPCDAIHVADELWRMAGITEKEKYKKEGCSFCAVGCDEIHYKNSKVNKYANMHVIHDARKSHYGREIYFELEQIATKTYNFGTDKYGTWLVDVVETAKERDAWLWLEGYGVKSHIHGTFHGNQSWYDFMITLRCCIKEDKRFYLEDYAPEELDEEDEEE